ncbi:hypothetical protein CIY_27360 [Butyrivibrio fibrisolvens 16/4]|nr:hypothetical protein CIY_27360 [Butyrivibrio fibrisolvens 16/4]
MKKEIIYCSTVCSEKYYRDVYVKNNCFPGQQEQKYHRLIVEGLSVCNDIDTVVLSMPPFIKNSGIVTDVSEEVDNSVNYQYLTCKYKNTIQKIIIQMTQILRVARKIVF